jgi:transposase-like protein
MAETTQRTSHSSRLAWWRGQIQRQPKTGLSVAEFCRQLGVSVATFYYWKRRTHPGAQAAFDPVPPQPPVAHPTTTAAHFVPVTLLDPAAGTQLEIELTNACVVRLRGAIDPELLAAAIRAAGQLGGPRQGAD